MQFKGAILNLMQAVGTFDLLRYAHRRHALILSYRRFSPREEEGRISASAFAEQLDYLTSHYRIVSLREMVSHLNSDAPLPSGLAALTLNDAYEDVYEVAYPLLRRYRVPATVFAVTDFLDGHSWMWTDKIDHICRTAPRQWLTTRIEGQESWLALRNEDSRRKTAVRVRELLARIPTEAREDSIEKLARALQVRLPEHAPEGVRPITWAQAREMDANGIEIGSKTCSGANLSTLSDTRLAREIGESRTRLEEVLGHSVDQFCYPNGDQDERVQCEVARAGYRIAVTRGSGLNKRGDDPLTLRRIHTERDLARFLQTTSGYGEIRDKVRVTYWKSSLPSTPLLDPPNQRL